MEAHRIYGENVSINTELVKKFYDKRATLIGEKGWGAVALGDEDPSITVRGNDYDRNIILPQLGINSTSRVLELGCGMGRWAKIVLPNCDFYCGVDFSSDILAVAKEMCRSYEDHSAFYSMSALEAVRKGPQYFRGTFNCIILSGICIYINDAELSEIFAHLPNLCSNQGTIYIKETTALESRLTLNEFPSEALRSNYNAIYRTIQEYNMLFQPLQKAGFIMEKQFFLPAEVGRKREETNGCCTIFKR